ncbi:MAG: hypothetical protein UT34_C0001G0530 [candidate division WS6 bacterium GW2011_GWF2_39_15]|uniref:ASCH domain-containing protein n=1 Tax=candidate division WS6 bacterium GW2011_GWF2_39_15 TaxID=1619100 RepID=A0A0G0MR22_9BACT|nr:MAG: hypothetical protein UT34_C0001G0530 [candidate division WS6 bacterium GW2011_GWF2_39_15]
MEKIVKFTPQLTELIKQGKKTTTWRLFDDKNLSVGDIIILATRDGENVTNFGKAKIKNITMRTLDTLRPEDYAGHEPSKDPVGDYKVYYGDKVQPNTEVKIIKFEVMEISS